MREHVRFFKKTILRNWFSRLIFIHVRAIGQFSISFSNVIVSIGTHYENQVKN